MRALAVLILLYLSASAGAQNTPGEQARAAIAQISEATAALDDSQTARDRVQALTRIIVAFEEGLAALRSGLRDATARQSELQARLAAHDGEIAELLLALQRVGSTSSPALHLHPGGPLGTVRAGMLVADLAPAMNADAEDLRRDLEELSQLRLLQEDASRQLESALRDLQMARAALSQAIAERVDLPKRFRSDPVREAILISSAETLGQFAAELDQVSPTPVSETDMRISAQKGSLPLPVQGTVLRGAGEADAAGVTRPGMLLRTEPRALVISPAAATLRYVGPLLDFGTVAILEPQTDVLFVFAGLGSVYGATGDLIAAGDPIGLMGDGRDKSAADVSTDGDGAGTAGVETLYIEVREYNRPQNPTLWFDTDKDG